MKTRALAALPLLVATALFAYVSRSVAPALVVALGVAVAVPLAARLDASRRVQRAVLVAVGLLAVVVVAPAVLPLGAPAPTGPAGVWGIVIVTALLLTLARRFFRDAEGGLAVDVALLATVVAGCGQRRVGPVYLVAVVLVAAAVIAVSRTRDERYGWSVVEARSSRGLAGMLVGVGLLSAAAIFALPRSSRSRSTSSIATSCPPGRRTWASPRASE